MPTKFAAFCDGPTTIAQGPRIRGLIDLVLNPLHPYARRPMAGEGYCAYLWTILFSESAYVGFEFIEGLQAACGSHSRSRRWSKIGLPPTETEPKQTV